MHLESLVNNQQAKEIQVYMICPAPSGTMKVLIHLVAVISSSLRECVAIQSVPPKLKNISYFSDCLLAWLS